MKPLLIASLLTLPLSAQAQTLEGTCLFTTRFPDPQPLGPRVAYRLDEEHPIQELRREGTAVYLIRRQGGPTEYFLSIRVNDPARGMELSATRPFGLKNEDQLQLSPPFELPIVVCNPGPEPKGD